jgi:flavin-dependent dehydrogenase
MARRPIGGVAVVGDGPAGATLATLLARRGVRVGLFSPGRPRGLVVGESLLPAVVPILRELGIEDEVRSYGELKPGATFLLRSGDAIGFRFADSAGRLPGYAYNVPRDRFDATLLEVCRASGARVFEGRARLERDPAAAGRVRIVPSDGDGVRDFFGGEPEWIVDATGRSRRIARLLDLPTRTGDRRDVALFAHCEGVAIENPGHVHMDHLARGWCWRIPLPGCVSLGIVVGEDALAPFAGSLEERYDAYLQSDPHLKSITASARRVSMVAKYGNYQLTTLQGAGAGWVLVGDALGFVDPIFSSGLFLAMDGARALARALLQGGRAALRRYEQRQRRHLLAWQRVVSYYYDGRLFELIKMGRPEEPNWIGRRINPHVTTRVSRILTGESTTGPYSPRLLDFLVEHALRVGDPGALRIR